MECKVLSPVSLWLVLLVLIETLWNVKKRRHVRKYLFQPGINRNIVECKAVLRLLYNPMCPVLIETLWNVKKLALKLITVGIPVLIETLWNVK